MPTRTWFRVFRLSWRRGIVRDEAAHRMACHLTHWATTRGIVRDMRRVMDAYAHVHAVSVRTGWKDLARLVDAGLVRKVAGSAPGRPAVYALVLDLARLPADFPKDLGRELEKTADDPKSRAQGKPTLASIHAALSSCVTVQYGAASTPTPLRSVGCGQVHTSPYTREGPTPPPRPRPPERSYEPAQVSALGENLSYDEWDRARQVLADCAPWWRMQRAGRVTAGQETLGEAAARAVEHLVVLLLRYMPPGEAVELLTDQVASARDLAGVVQYRIGRVLRAMRRRRSLALDDGTGYQAMQAQFAAGRARAAQARSEALAAARAAVNAARGAGDAERKRWERADEAAAAVQWAAEPDEPVPAVVRMLDPRDVARARALARARQERARMAS